jgi:hypothetical protein
VKKRFDSGRTTLLIILINLVQAALIAAVLFYIIDMGMGAELLTDPWIMFLFAVIAAAVVINSITAFRNRAGFIRSGHEFRLLEDTLDRLEKLNTELRAQRHDFMNHLQVVHSLIEMDEYKAADEYIEKVYDDIQRGKQNNEDFCCRCQRASSGEVMACEKQDINMELDVRTQLKTLLSHPGSFAGCLGT